MILLSTSISSSIVPSSGVDDTVPSGVKEPSGAGLVLSYVRLMVLFLQQLRYKYSGKLFPTLQREEQ